jgi:hypothetical protein
MKELFERIVQVVKSSVSPVEGDSIIVDGVAVPISGDTFENVDSVSGRVTFIDGGQAVLMSSPSFSLQFIRVVASAFEGVKKVEQQKHEFYVFAYAVGDQDVTYKAQIFVVSGQKLVDEEDLLFGSMDETIRAGIERAEISKVGGVARRFAELALAASISGAVVVDGHLQKTLTHEENYLDRLGGNVSGLTKTTGVFTSSGRAAGAVLNNLGSGVWQYPTSSGMWFVKLHRDSDYVFRYETNGENIVGQLVGQSVDPTFLGYPYGLVWVDKIARVSHREAAMLRTEFFVRLGKDGALVKKYMNASNAHDVLDSIG